jgi:hypothetical protein
VDPPEQTDRYLPVYYPGTVNEQSASAVEVQAGTEAGGVNIIVGPVRTRHVRGVIVDGKTGKPDQYGSLTLLDGLENMSRDRLTVDHETGLFDISLFPGAQTLMANAAGGVGYTTVQVGDSDIENLTIVTMPEFDIRGKVSVEGGVLNATVFDTLRISLLRDPPPSNLRGASLSYSTPLSDGSITVEASLGDFRVNIAPILNVNRLLPVNVSGALQDAYVKSIRLGNIDVLDGGLHLERPPTAPIEIVIGTKLATIEGTVVSTQQQSAGDVPVVLVPDVRRRNELYKSTTSDESGRFRFDHVAPGSYKIFASTDIQNDDWYDPDFMASHETQGTPVRVEEGGKQEVQTPIR